MDTPPACPLEGEGNIRGKILIQPPDVWVSKKKSFFKAVKFAGTVNIGKILLGVHPCNFGCHPFMANL